LTQNPTLLDSITSRLISYPLVLLSHFLSSSMVMWNPQLDALEPGYRVLRYDMRGRGKSGALQGYYTLEQLSADVIQDLTTHTDL